MNPELVKRNPCFSRGKVRFPMKTACKKEAAGYIYRQNIEKTSFFYAAAFPARTDCHEKIL